MLDDFFMRALFAVVGVALVVGPLGCFVVWRRMAYFGDTLSHAALLGVAVALLLEVNVTLAVFVVSVVVSMSLLLLQKRAPLSADALLGLLSHSALALGLVLLAFLTWIRFDLTGLLFGDILSVSKADVGIIWGGGALVLAILAVIWRPLFAGTVNQELAVAEGMSYERANIVFLLLLAAVIAISIKIVGVLLITAMLIIPAAAARRFALGPEQMVIYAMILGALSVMAGLAGSWQWDTPTGPSIVVASLLSFIIAMTPIANIMKKKNGAANVESKGTK